MPLYFTDKKRRWPPSKPTQYVLACALLVVGLIILGTWLFVRFIYTEPTHTDPSTDSTTVNVDELPNDSYCLIIVEDVGYERFALVKASPKNTSITVSALSPSLETDEGFLYSVLKKHGPARAAQVIAQKLGLHELHYMAFSVNDVETLFTRLGHNLQFTIPEEVNYQDENGGTIRLKAETHNLTPTQIASLLRYTRWENKTHEENLAADITAAVINQCLLPGKSLQGYFELLSNTSVTDLRIDQFNAYLSGLQHLANANHGDIAQRNDNILP